MKYFKHIFLSLSLVISFSGYDFLDCDESSEYTKEDVFSSFERTKRMVSNIYSYLPYDFCQVDGAMLDAATDDAVHVYEKSDIQKMNNGTWSANNSVDDVFGKMYEGIRAANLYLVESKDLDFKEWEYSDEYQNVMMEFKNTPYEVRFLRAFFYFELIKRYRNVPLITTVLNSEEANRVEPSSFEDIAAFIINECSDVAKSLPVNYSGFASKETGRITKGAALALKSRVSLYLASPLFNAQSDKTKWIAAAKSAFEIIGNQSLGYSIEPKYETLFTPSNNVNPEVILCRPVGETGDFERSNYPMGVEGGKTSTCPTQNLVDAFEMKNGDPFSWDNEAMAKNPYENRDNRLFYTIVYNGMSWPKNPVEIWEGGKNGLPLQNATVTGYYLKKYLNKEIEFSAGSKVTKKHHNWILFRYAEILLNYAEAMINAYDNPNYKDAELTMSALEAINLIRTRGIVKLPPLSNTISASVFMDKLKHERRVEFAFEGHRFWDIRRWKDLEKTGDIYGVKIEKVNGETKYTKFLLESRKISSRMYFYPIPANEIFINKKLKQNTGW